MLRVTFLLSVLISLGLFTKNPLARHCRVCGVTAPISLAGYNPPYIHGQLVVPRYKYPWIMPIALKGKENHFFCAGALISKRFVLTAAHCVRDEEFKNEFNCTRGETVVSCFLPPEKLVALIMGDLYEDPLREMVCRKIHVHPDYDYENELNDIALLELRMPVSRCNKYIFPICLPQVPISKMNGEVIVAGWGTFKLPEINGGRQKLWEGRATEEDPVHCQKEHNLEKMRDKIYCTRFDPRNNQSYCEGEAGSSVFASFDGVYYSLGVTSTYLENTCPISGLVSFAGTYGYIDFIRRIAGELPSPPKPLLGIEQISKQNLTSEL